MSETPRHDEVRHERQDVSLRPVVWFLGALLGAAVVIQLGLWGLFRFFEKREERRDPARAPLAAPRAGLSTSGRAALFPEPRLQTRSVANASQLLANERRLLTSYGWTDRRAGLVRIPIDRAMELVLETGLLSTPVAAPAPTPTPPASRKPSPSGARPEAPR
jgi:hypothetical protein